MPSISLDWCEVLEKLQPIGKLTMRAQKKDERAYTILIESRVARAHELSDVFRGIGEAKGSGARGWPLYAYSDMGIALPNNVCVGGGGALLEHQINRDAQLFVHRGPTSPYIPWPPSAAFCGGTVLDCAPPPALIAAACKCQAFRRWGRARWTSATPSIGGSTRISST